MTAVSASRTPPTCHFQTRTLEKWRSFLILLIKGGFTAVPLDKKNGSTNNFSLLNLACEEHFHILNNIFVQCKGALLKIRLLYWHLWFNEEPLTCSVCHNKEKKYILRTVCWKDRRGTKNGSPMAMALLWKIPLFETFIFMEYWHYWTVISINLRVVFPQTLKYPSSNRNSFLCSSVDGWDFSLVWPTFFRIVI